ncbi:MAG TPA: SIR2 family protein [Chitinophagaceae bacterium]|nr:SIR2 family protein [Chitinophagaceae bacterium]
MGLKVHRVISRRLPEPGLMPEDTPELHALAQYVRAGRCILFVGAGLPSGAGLPTWVELMERLVKKITCYGINEGVVPNYISLPVSEEDAWKDPVVVAVQKELGKKTFDQLLKQIRRTTALTSEPEIILLALEIVGRTSIERAELMRLLQQKRFPELAEFCRNRLGNERFNQEIRKALVPKSGLPAAFRHIVRTPFACIVTTNFDTLIERAYEQFGQTGIPRAPTGVELTQLGTLLIDDSFFVLKAHGDALRPETMIFSANDYRRLIHATPAFQAFFNSMLMTHALLFVGYSLNDANFRLLLDQQFTMFNGQVPPRYALLSGVGAAEEDILWQTARLQVLSYPDGKHEHVERFLGRLARVTKQPGAIIPSKPATPSPKTGIINTDEASTLFNTSIRDGRLLVELVRPANSKTQPTTWAMQVSQKDFEDFKSSIKDVVKAHTQYHSAMPEINAIKEHFLKLFPAELFRKLAALKPGSPIRFVCRHGTHRIPWEWLPAAKTPLCLRHSVSRCPITLSDTARGYRILNKRVRALIIGDAGSGQPPQLWPLDEAEREATEIVKRLRNKLSPKGVTHLSRKTATRNRILRELREGDYDIIHFAGHAWFTNRESYLWAWDNVMLGSELTPMLSRRPPSLLVMSTHFTSFVPLGINEDLMAKLAGKTTALHEIEAQHSLDFAENAMRCGVATFVGSFGEPPEKDTADTMIAFYEGLLAGDSVAGSLLKARKRRVQKGFTSSLLVTATGYGDLRLVNKK